MADDKVTSFIGGPNAHYTVIAGDDGESFRFDSGQKYQNEEIPKSVLAAIQDGVPGHDFTSGTEQTVEKHLDKAREEQADLGQNQEA